MTSRSALLLLAAACVATRPAAAQPAADVPTDSAIMARVAAVVQNTGRCAEAWPGYWHPGKPFGVTRQEDRSVFVYLPAPHAPFAPVQGSHVPPVLRGSLYLHRPPAGEFRAFDIYHRLGDLRVPLIRAYSPHLRADVETVYHEGFHAHQDERFVPLPGGGRAAFGSQSTSIPLTVPLAEFEARAATERRLLSAALAAEAPDSLHALLRRYLAVRAERAAAGPALQPFERWEERAEGTAQFVGLLCTALASGMDRERVRARIRDALAEEQPALLGGRPNKWRGYGVGAALSLLLDDLGVPGWRAEVEGGAALDDLLARAVGAR